MSVEALFSTAAPNVLPLAIHSRDGRVWLLTHTGVVVADPNISPDNYSPPPVLLTRVAMDGQTIASYGGIAPTVAIANLKTLKQPLRLPPSHHHLEFDFTAFHFRAAENIHFRYQLSGLDNGWINAGTERYADFSRLTAGNYQFRVAACIGDGPWTEAPAALSIIVTPFFWQTWWFRVLVVLISVSSVILIVRYISFRHLQMEMKSLEQQAAIERERGRIARDIHDDLGNRLTKIQLLAGLVQRDDASSDKPDGHVHQISSAAQDATNALDEIVWAINPRNDTLPDLINYLGQFAVEFLRSANIRCRVDLPDHPPAKPVSAEVRHNLFLVVKESLNNIVRHAKARQVSLMIFATDESIGIVIEDDGCGFNGEAKNNGADGLENMRQRIVEIGGQFQISSKAGSGTQVSFNGPWLAKK
jgi:signal transduction histidine kinase